PELRRDDAAADPDARRLRELLAAAEEAPPVDTPAAPEAKPAPFNPGASLSIVGPPGSAAAYRRLLAINKRLNSELRLPRLLELILDTVLDLTAAERGFILLTAGEGQWRVAAARNIAEESLAPGAASF